MTVYTLAHWHVRPGREEAFVAAWERLAAWTKEYAPEARGTLLRDRERPSTFVSFGPWPDSAAAAAWRERPEFQELVAEIGELLERFEPALFDVARDVR